jgi:uncharacterized damage-inducible protein DinB
MNDNDHFATLARGNVWVVCRRHGHVDALPFAATPALVFNHGTRHRGRFATTVTAIGHECTELDMMWMLPVESEKS